MDDKDRQLVTLLRKNARLPVAALAKALGGSRGTVQNRINRLIEHGTIQGFTIRVRPDAEPARVRAVMMIAVEGERSERIIKLLRGHPEIAEVHTTNGRWDLVVEISAQSLADLDDVLRRLRQTPGVTASETTLLLATPRSARARL